MLIDTDDVDVDWGVGKSSSSDNSSRSSITT